MIEKLEELRRKAEKWLKWREESNRRATEYIPKPKDENRAVRENKITSLSPNLCRDASCDDCFGRLNWEVHNPGELGMEYWIANCDCNSGSRLWTLSVETVKLTSINSEKGT